MQISFHGAAGDVTGSCHLIEAAGKRILIDCGMFQGSRSLEDENAEPFGFDPAAIDCLLLTHAHLDHCGRIPLLRKRGFRGPVYTTAATLDLARLVLMDAAGLQREEFRRRAHASAAHAGNGHDAPPPHEPLFDVEDVQDLFSHCHGTAQYGKALDLAPGIQATFCNAGHILGSAWILLELSEGGASRRVIFSGDLGNRDKPILNPPEPPPPADAVIMESTYGDRNHRSQAESVAEFRDTVVAALKAGGNVVIPTFALERAQDLLYYLRQMVEARDLPQSTQVFLDSPMAISATDIFRHHMESLNSETRNLLDEGHDPFSVPGLHITREVEASKGINNVSGGAIIMAGSGMAAGGRILHHLVRNLGRPECAVIIVGFAGKGTLARQIVDGAKQVHILGQGVPVAAHVSVIGGFSAHAGHDDLIQWVNSAKPSRIFLVHGEVEAANALAKDLASLKAKVELPQIGQSFDL